ncbi:hypothetical protein HJ526_16945 [Donghicola sp. C2-DW-16]|uniref:Uncharacterized protein n=1 Tax=Donghicola mangrovi TaxID=2729614 RepID=A0A850Q7I8_9RHOB|nr:hypothetical protein [Donghicola mangrovi]NVO24884.1 hypothetical protein [Donghicola mangrovi]NVO29115.1 hypothetical protein [Donghicola mangrovi]
MSLTQVAFTVLGAFLALVAVIGLRLGWTAATITETEVIERYASAYVAEAGGGAELTDCHAEAGQTWWIKLRVVCAAADGREWRFGAGLWGQLMYVERITPHHKEIRI